MPSIFGILSSVLWQAGEAHVAAEQTPTQITDVVQAVATILLTLLTALYVVLTHRLARATQAQAHERLYNQNQAILEVLIVNPSVRPYIYASKPLDGTEAEDVRERIKIVAEMFAGFIEQVALQADEGLPNSTRSHFKT